MAEDEGMNGDGCRRCLKDGIITSLYFITRLHQAMSCLWVPRCSAAPQIAQANNFLQVYALDGRKAKTSTTCST